MDIWEKWSEHYKSFGINSDEICKDGIINPDEYQRHSPKLLFILKETNQWKGGDIRSLMKDGPKQIMAHNIARWTAAILDSDKEFNAINNKDTMREMLSRIAVINLKKITGDSEANMTLVGVYAYMDRELLLEQIAEIAPKIIIACGTFDILVWLLGLEINPIKIMEKPILYSDRKILILPWGHPSFRGDASKPYQKLKEWYANMKQKYPEIGLR